MVNQLPPEFNVQTFKTLGRCDVPKFRCSLYSLLSLFEQRVFANSFAANNIRTLS
jgi:hypothetical protein